MKPKSPERELKTQGDLFRSRLEQILNRAHPLFVLSKEIDWAVFEEQFGGLYSENGRPGVPTRVMVGLHYLKHMFDESDESVVERFVENPYWQYFCGFEYFQHKFPIDPSSMTRWRHRLGSERMKQLLTETIETAKKRGEINRRQASKVNVDTTVQEKAIAYPTDQRLYHKARVSLVRAAQQRGIRLRQNYVRVGKRALAKHARYAHAKQWKRARVQSRRLRTYLGRVIRDIERKCERPDEQLSKLLKVSKAIHGQKRGDKNKVYSVYAPEVECISKGKVHKRYEFGCKTSVVSTSKDNWILDIEALHGNPYDGHTLKRALSNAEINSGYKVTHAFCDKGYKGAGKELERVDLYLSGARNLSRAFRRWLKRRVAIEPVIGHLKSEHRMDRNHLAGVQGDRINAILAACGFNLRKLYRAIARCFFVLLALIRVVGLRKRPRELLEPSIC